MKPLTFVPTRGPTRSSVTANLRYRAVSMELAAYLDDRHVEMHIVTESGQTVSIVCEQDSIFAVQRNIERMGRDCPEIATWTRPAALRVAAARFPRPLLAITASDVPRPPLLAR
jgi:hypothetical protein